MNFLFSLSQPCTETFYLTLFSQYRTDMIVDLVEYIRQAQAITLHSGSDLKEIFFKDAVYKATGLSAFNLFDEVSFDGSSIERKMKANLYESLADRLRRMVHATADPRAHTKGRAISHSSPPSHLADRAVDKHQIRPKSATQSLRAVRASAAARRRHGRSIGRMQVSDLRPLIWPTRNYFPFHLAGH